MKKILGVVRVSTEQQENESQKAELTNYILSFGYQEEEIEWIATAGASARKANKKYLEMLEDIKNAITVNPTIKAVAFWHINRLGRQDTYIINMKNWFIENGIQVYIKTPTLTLLNEDGTVNAGAEIAWGVFATMVKQDTKEMFAKMERGRERCKKEGLYYGGNIGYGFRLNKQTKKIERNEEEITKLKEIFAIYCESKLSTYQLTKEVNERGITVRNGEKLTVSFIQHLLVNDKLKALVGEDLFNKAQEIKNGKHYKRKSKHIRIISGLGVCPCCGGRMIANDKEYRCYNRYSKKTETTCTSSNIVNSNVIDNLAFEIATLSYADYMAQSNEEALEDYKKEMAANKQKENEYIKKLNTIDSKTSRAKTLYIEGDITKKEYTNLKETIETEKVSITRNIESLKERNQYLEIRIGVIEGNCDLDNTLRALDDSDKFSAEKANEIVHKFIKRIDFDFKNKGEYGIKITTIDNAEWHFVCYPHNRKTDKLFLAKDGKQTPFKLLIRYNNGTREDNPKVF